ncbi:MAG: cytochrome C biogenesis protein, partial [Flavobacteriia bacterium]
MKKIFNFLFSTRLTGILFIVFAATMGIATFIENDFGTQTAMAVVYHAWWFEMIMVIFMINFIGNISKYRLLRKEKISVLTFHLAFILIILGAGITRYISFEGIMPIFEGETTNTMLSDKAYLKLHIDDGKEQKNPIYKEYLFSSISDQDAGFTAGAGKFFNLLRGGNDFKISTDFKGKPVEVAYVNYVSNAFEKFIPDENGKTYLKIVETGGGGRHDHFLLRGEVISLHNFLFAFDKPTEGAVNIITENDTLKIKTPFEGTYMIMTTQEQRKVAKDSVQDFHLRSLYQFGGIRFVAPDAPQQGRMELVSADKNQHLNDLLEVKVRSGNEEKIVQLYGNSNQVSRPESFSLNGLNFRLSYGAKQMTLPFSVKLRDFQLDRYPGSMSPKSYASEITVIDKDKTFDYRIFMNHVLDYKGYRFFQSSYNDTGEVEQTFLSVNHDKLGTWTTYIGYGLLFLGLILILFEKKTRFGTLRKMLKKIKEKKARLTILIFLIGLGAFSQENHQNNIDIDSLLQSTKVSKEHARNFGSLVIQDEGGRMKPV